MRSIYLLLFTILLSYCSTNVSAAMQTSSTKNPQTLYTYWCPQVSEISYSNGYAYAKTTRNGIDASWKTAQQTDGTKIDQFLSAMIISDNLGNPPYTIYCYYQTTYGSGPSGKILMQPDPLDSLRAQGAVGTGWVDDKEPESDSETCQGMGSEDDSPQTCQFSVEKPGDH